LGCEKFHVTSLFTQSIVAIDKRAFESLKWEFDYNAENFRIEFPSLIFDCYERKANKNSKKSKVYIHVSSQNREDLLKPMRVLNDLFTPKYISLLDAEFRYLGGTEGDRLL
jgi:hypothetical protein